MGVGRMPQGRTQVYKDLELGFSDVLKHVIYHDGDILMPKLCAPLFVAGSLDACVSNDSHCVNGFRYRRISFS